MKPLIPTALLSASILSPTNALYIPGASPDNGEYHSLHARADLIQGQCYNGQILDPDLKQDNSSHTRHTKRAASAVTKDGALFRSPKDTKLVYWRSWKAEINAGGGSTPGPSSPLNQITVMQNEERTTSDARQYSNKKVRKGLKKEQDGQKPAKEEEQTKTI
ncbi:hypothetical protein P280DRAFT_514583 [Massarina eburnea CBS 473.64]|uniref:Uncharacterized protein n=1 Tax=Massarina eburnea CBS 473.64 TaxID=1395130 RepID=A0A6A6SCZ1_9PLEO|nr:hypothetical protein P280DRAFT_514583 [Massarina eburnea CBS 473.64]